MMNRKVVTIASKNPVKINSTKQAFEKAFKREAFEFKGLHVDSEVPDQPVGENETFKGACNRLKNIRELHPESDYWVSMEGGISFNNEDEMEAFAWIVIESKERKGKARTANFYLPQEVAQLVKSGMELGHADDQVFGKNNSKHHSGSVGILTHGLLNRTEYYEQAVLLALIPFLNLKLNF